MDSMDDSKSFFKHVLNIKYYSIRLNCFNSGYTSE